MSRTRRSSKAPGYEFWTARPGNRHGIHGYGPAAKKRTHRMERRAGARQVRKEAEAA